MRDVDRRARPAHRLRPLAGGMMLDPRGTHRPLSAISSQNQNPCRETGPSVWPRPARPARNALVLAGGLVGLAAARACELDGTQLLSLRAHDPRSRARSLLSQAGNQGRGDAPANPTGPTLDAPGTPRQSPRGGAVRRARAKARKGDFPLAPRVSSIPAAGRGPPPLSAAPGGGDEPPRRRPARLRRRPPSPPRRQRA